MQSWFVSLALLLTACAAGGDSDQPLSPAMIRHDLVGGTLMGLENGRQVYIYFAPSGTAVRYGDSAEFGQWRAEQGKGLCLSWREEGERCTPVYQVHIGRYRLGDEEFNVYRRPPGGYRPGMPMR